ncbi:hypothetical protein [Bacillus luti]|nr:hypothetical protein [Bacillus cereus]HDR8329572.1 hypothetical protein [Bacillus cereus]HDR8332901.1 hypothetical protein [Bacillus cereus]
MINAVGFSLLLIIEKVIYAMTVPKEEATATSIPRRKRKRTNNQENLY